MIKAVQMEILSVWLSIDEILYGLSLFNFLVQISCEMGSIF